MPPRTALEKTMDSVRERLRSAWKRYQYRRIQKAIHTYSAEKHFLTGRFHPVVGQATMRMVLKEIERNKLPFHADQWRPWLKSGKHSHLLPRLNGGDQEKARPDQESSSSLEDVKFPRPSLDPSASEETARIIMIPQGQGLEVIRKGREWYSVFHCV